MEASLPTAAATGEPAAAGLTRTGRLAILAAVEGVRSRGVRLAVEAIGGREPVTVLGHGLTGSRRDPDRFDRLLFLLPARLERTSAARARLLRLAGQLASRPLPDVADAVIREEEALGAFEAFPAARDLRREAILAMNGDGMPQAIRECIDDPPVRDPVSE